METKEAELAQVHAELVEVIGRPESQDNFPQYPAAVFDGRNATGMKSVRLSIGSVGLDPTRYNGEEGRGDDHIWVNTVLPQFPGGDTCLPDIEGRVRVVRPPIGENQGTVYIQADAMTKDAESRLVKRVFVLHPNGRTEVYDHHSIWYQAGGMGGRDVAPVKIDELVMPDGFWQGILDLARSTVSSTSEK